MKVGLQSLAASLMHGFADLAMKDNPLRPHLSPVIDRFAKENFEAQDIDISAERMAEGLGILKRPRAAGRARGKGKLNPKGKL
jgi:hypothetical protein